MPAHVCPLCNAEVRGESHELVRHMVACRSAGSIAAQDAAAQDASASVHEVSVFADGVIDRSDVVADEIDMLRAMYDDTLVVAPASERTLESLTIDIVSTDGEQRVVLKVQYVQGYPCIPPRMSFYHPTGAALRGSTIAVVRAAITTAAVECTATSTPCVQQVVCAIVDALDAADTAATPAPATPVLAPATPQRTPQIAAAPSPHSGHPAGLPTLSQAGSRQQDLLTLHLLHRLCASADAEQLGGTLYSNLVLYLRDLGVVRSDVEYSERQLRRHFRRQLEQARDVTTSWLWTVAGGSAATRASDVQNMRFTREFITLDDLGAGGFGSVVTCIKLLDQRKYAVKKIVMKKHRTETVLREVRTLAALRHPNIVRYYDAWVEDGIHGDVVEAESDESSVDMTDSSASEYDDSDDDCPAGANFWETAASSSSPESSDSDWRLPTTESAAENAFCTVFMQMELCQQRNLQHYIDSGELIGREDVMFNVLRQLLQVISHVHGQQVMHRDLKPANVLFDGSASDILCDIKVADFGLARRTDDDNECAGDEQVVVQHADPTSDSRLTAGCGTALYSAPEQIDTSLGDGYDARVDEYSIGMIALEMWCSAVLQYDFRERRDALLQLRETGRVPPALARSRPVVAAIIEGLVRRDAHTRFSAEAVLTRDDLPGDPAEIAAALSTIEQYRDRIAERVMNRMHDTARSSRHITDAVGLTELTVVPLVQAFSQRARMHNARPIDARCTFVPAGAIPAQANVQREYLLNRHGDAFVLLHSPALAVAYWFAQRQRALTAEVHTCFRASCVHARDPSAIVGTLAIWAGQHLSGALVLAEAAAFVHGVARFIDVTAGKLSILVGHTVITTALQTAALSPNDRRCARVVLDSVQEWSDYVEELVRSIKLCESDKAALDEADDFMRTVLSKRVCGDTPIELDPRMAVAGDAPGAMMRLVRVANNAVQDPPLAVVHGDPLAGFAGHRSRLAIVSVYFNAIAAASKSLPYVKSLPPIPGVAVAARVGATPADSFFAARECWDLGVTAEPFYKHERSEETLLREVSSSARLSHALLVSQKGQMRLVRLSTRDARALEFVSEVRADFLTMGANAPPTMPKPAPPSVQFVGAAQSSQVQRATESFANHAPYFAPRVVLVVNASVADIRSAIDDFIAGKCTSNTHGLAEWLKHKGSQHTSIAVYSSEEDKMELFVNHSRVSRNTRAPPPQQSGKKGGGKK